MKKPLLILLALLFSTFANASCRFYQGGYTETNMSFGNVTVQRDALPGTVINSQTINVPKFGPICDNGAFGVWDVGIFKDLSSISQVYKTNIEGVGIRISTSYGVIRNEHLTPSSMFQDLSSVKAELVKIEGEAQSGELSTGLIMHWDVGDGQNAPLDMPVMKLFLSGGSVTALACSIQSGNTLAFPMGKVSVDQFENIGAVSQTTVTANLKLDCAQNANVNITLEGTKSPDTSDSSILALTGESNVATGIGVQILYNNSPIKINEPLSLGSSPGGVETYRLTARYIQTKEQIHTGSANATAVLNLTYQ